MQITKLLKYNNFKLGIEHDNSGSSESQPAEKKVSKPSLKELRGGIHPAKLFVGSMVAASVAGINIHNYMETQHGLNVYAEESGQVNPENLKPFARSKYLEDQNSPEKVALKSAGEEIRKALSNNLTNSHFSRVVVNGDAGTLVLLTHDIKGEYELEDKKVAQNNVYTGEDERDPSLMEDFVSSIKEKFRAQYQILEVTTSDYGTKVIINYKLKK